MHGRTNVWRTGYLPSRYKNGIELDNTPLKVMQWWNINDLYRNVLCRNLVCWGFGIIACAMAIGKFVFCLITKMPGRSLNYTLIKISSYSYTMQLVSFLYPSLLRHLVYMFFMWNLLFCGQLIVQSAPSLCAHTPHTTYIVIARSPFPIHNCYHGAKIDCILVQYKHCKWT